MKRFFEKAFGRVTITFIILMLQILWFVGFIYALRSYYVIFSSVMSLLSLAIILSISSKRDNPAYKLAWTTLVLTLPVFGMLLYLLFGSSNVNRRVRKHFERNDRQLEKYLPENKDVIEEVREHDRQIGNICRYVKNVANYPIYRNDTAEYHALGDEGIERLKQELRKAKEFIFMEYFIVDADSKVFLEILDILAEKVREGVEVRLIYDDVGSVAYLNKKDVRRITKLGIKIRTFNPIVPVLSVFMNNRDHRKISVIDGKVAFTGGYNLSDEYANIRQPYGKWKDTGLMCTGACVDTFTCMFLGMWNSIGKPDRDYDIYFGKCEPVSKENSDGYIQPYADTPLDGERVGEDVYLNIIKTACDYIYIFTPYLVIDNEMMSELCLAAKSGVDVRIITPGIPDKKIVFLITQSYYQQLLEAGVKIYQYTPGFVHAKCYVCDDNVATVGTINMDYRSLFLHFECGVFLYENKMIGDIKKDFLETMVQCEEITLENIRKRNVFVRLFQVVLRLFAPMV